MEEELKSKIISEQNTFKNNFKDTIKNVILPAFSDFAALIIKDPDLSAYLAQRVKIIKYEHDFLSISVVSASLNRSAQLDIVGIAEELKVEFAFLTNDPDAEFCSIFMNLDQVEKVAL